MEDLTPYILAIMGIIVSVFGFFIKQTLSDLKQTNQDLCKKYHELDKNQQKISSDVGHAIETAHDIKDLMKEMVKNNHE